MISLWHLLFSNRSDISTDNVLYAIWRDSKGMQMNKNEQYFPDGRTHIWFVVDFHQDSNVDLDDAYISWRNFKNSNDANIEITLGPLWSTENLAIKMPKKSKCHKIHHR